MTGAMKSPFWLILVWFLRVIFIAILTAYVLINPIISLYVFLLHVILLCLGLFFLLKKLGIKTSLIGAVFFEFFYFITNISSLVYYIFKRQITWKGKSYDLRVSK